MLVGPVGRETLRAEPPCFDHAEWCWGPSLTGGHGVQARNLFRPAADVVRHPRRARRRRASPPATPARRRRRRSGSTSPPRARRRPAATCSTAARPTTRRPSGAGSTRPTRPRCRSSATPVTATRSPTSASTRSSTCSSPAHRRRRQPGPLGGRRPERHLRRDRRGRRRRAPSPAAPTASPSRARTSINNFVPSSANKTATVTARIQVTDGKVTVDAAGGTNTKLDYVDIVPVTERASAPAPRSPASTSRPAGAPAPHRYTNDTGAAYTAATGYGWISQTDSTPLSIVGNGRDRNARRSPTSASTRSCACSTPARRRRRPAGPLAVRAARWAPTTSPSRSATPPRPTGSHPPRRGRGHRRHRQLRAHRQPTSSSRPRCGSPCHRRLPHPRRRRRHQHQDQLRRHRRRRQHARDDHRASIPPNGATDVPLDTSVGLSPSHAVEQTTVNADHGQAARPGQRPGGRQLQLRRGRRRRSSSRPTERAGHRTPPTRSQTTTGLRGHRRQPLRRLHARRSRPARARPRRPRSTSTSRSRPTSPARPRSSSAPTASSTSATASVRSGATRSPPTRHVGRRTRCG